MTRIHYIFKELLKDIASNWAKIDGIAAVAKAFSLTLKSVSILLCKHMLELYVWTVDYPASAHLRSHLPVPFFACIVFCNSMIYCSCTASSLSGMLSRKKGAISYKALCLALNDLAQLQSIVLASTAPQKVTRRCYSSPAHVLRLIWRCPHGYFMRSYLAVTAVQWLGTRLAASLHVGIEKASHKPVTAHGHSIEHPGHISSIRVHVSRRPSSVSRVFEELWYALLDIYPWWEVSIAEILHIKEVEML